LRLRHLDANGVRQQLLTYTVALGYDATIPVDELHVFFRTLNDDLAAKATILAGQLGSLLEASRLNKVSREEHRRAEILAGLADIGQVPFLLRFNAFSEAHLDSIENPAFAGQFRAPEGRLLFLPTFRGTRTRFCASSSDASASTCGGSYASGNFVWRR
jgi:hypothetical protein